MGSALEADESSAAEDTLDHAAEDTANADVDFEDGQVVAAPSFASSKLTSFMRTTFAPVHIDDLLVEKIAIDAQHVFV